MELASLKRACKIVSQVRGVGNLLLFDPSVEYLSNLSGCKVTRPDPDFKPKRKRTNKDKQLFVKSMLRNYANGQLFISSTHDDDKKQIMEDGWCSVLHGFIEEETETLLRLKLQLYVDLDDTNDLPKIPKKNPCAVLMHDYATKLYLLKSYWDLPLHSVSYADLVPHISFLCKCVIYNKPFNKMNLPTVINHGKHCSETFVTWLKALAGIRDPASGCDICLVHDGQVDEHTCEGDCPGWSMFPTLGPFLCRIGKDTCRCRKEYNIVWLEQKEGIECPGCLIGLLRGGLKGWNIEGDYHGIPKTYDIDICSSHIFNMGFARKIIEVPISLSSNLPLELKGTNIFLQEICETKEDGSCSPVYEELRFKSDTVEGRPVYERVTRFKLQLPSRIANLTNLGKLLLDPEGILHHYDIQT